MTGSINSSQKEAPGSTHSDENVKNTGGPYESTLNKAFDKLTSEIFIFLLAYMILVIGLVVFGKGIPSGLRALLYIIPVLGILSYGWGRKRTVIQEPRASGIRVRALWVKGGYVGGVRGPDTFQDGDVDIAGAVVSKDGIVVGRDSGGDSTDEASRYLLSIFESLNENDRGELIQHALHIKHKQDS